MNKRCIAYFLLLCACQPTIEPNQALLQAAASGDTEALELACQQGGQLNAQSADGETPLGLAIERFRRGEGISGGKGLQPAHTNIEKLLMAGANPNTPHRHTTPLHLAVSTGYPEIVRLLLQYGADPNAETRSCLAPIWQTVYSNNAVIAAMLLQAGANPRALDARGLTPAQYLRQTGQSSSAVYRLVR